MIDLHCHMLPGIDDGAPDLEVALAMARCAVADGITVTACTPHIYPGMYENNLEGIARAIVALQQVLDEEGIALRLVIGADTHLAPDLSAGIREGRVPTLNGSRYLLLEPPHHSVPPRFEDSVFNLRTAGIVPVITHPERLSWIESHYESFERLVKGGAWMQITSGSLTGRFGKRPKYWGERMLDEGLVHILATDSHHIDRRPPLLAEGRDAAARRVGEEEAVHLVETRPRGIVDDTPSDSLPALPDRGADAKPSMWQRLFGNA
jgi:protein-tyrosine phosphatase